MTPIHPVKQNDIKPLVGQPVCAVLQDGTYYVGIIERVSDGHVYLQGVQGNGCVNSDPRNAKATISGLGSLFGSLGGGMGQGFGAGQGLGAGARGAGMLGGLLGRGAGLGGFSWGRGLKLGFNVLSFLFPLLGKFFF